MKKSSPITVLLELDSSDTRKGAIRNAIDLAQLARDFGFRCVFCGRLDRDFRILASRLGIPTVRGRSRMLSKWQIPLYGLNVVGWIARMIRLRPDIVHLNYEAWAPSLACAAHICRIPVVSRAVGYDPANRVHKWIDAYVANSTAHGQALLNSPAASKVVVTGPLVLQSPSNDDEDLPPIPPRRPHTCRLLFLGQVVQRKGIAVLVDSMSLVETAADLVMVGGDWSKDPFGNEIRNRLRQSEQDERVYLLNHRTDVDRLFQSSDVLIMPSLEDTLPRVIIEAMMKGLPVIATAVGGIPTLVVDKVTGLLVEPGDVRGLADAINKLVTSPDLRKRFGQAARTRAESELRPETTLARYAVLYNRLANRSS